MIRQVFQPCGELQPSLVFLALSGLIPWLRRYGVTSQWILLLHIVVRLAATAPITMIFIQHGREADRDKPTR